MARAATMPADRMKPPVRPSAAKRKAQAALAPASCRDSFSKQVLRLEPTWLWVGSFFAHLLCMAWICLADCRPENCLAVERGMAERLKRYAAKLLFQFRVIIAGDSGKRRICEARIILLKATSGKVALAKAKQKGRK